jgi:hypothetical protein
LNHFRLIATATTIFLGLSLPTLAAPAETSAARTAPSGVLVDSAGKTMGPFFPAATGDNVRALIKVNGQVVIIALSWLLVNSQGALWNDPTKLVASSQSTNNFPSYVFFDGPNCTGSAMLLASLNGSQGTVPAVTVGDGYGAGHVYVATSVQPTIRSYQSYMRSDGVCSVAVESNPTILVTSIVDLSTLYKAPYTVK